MLDAGAQLVQGIEFFAGAQVGVELHRRVGAVQIAMEAGDEGLAGHLGGVVVDGGAGAQAGGRGVGPAVDPGAGDVDAVPRQLVALRVDLVDGGHPQGAAQPGPMLHREPDGIGRAQHGVDGGNVAAFQRRADAGGGDRPALERGYGQDVHFHAQRRAQLFQQGGVPGGLGPKGEVLAAEKGAGPAVGHQPQDELFRRHGHDVRKGRHQIVLDPQPRHNAALVLHREQAAALDLAAARQLEGEQRRRRAVGPGPVHRAADHRPVPDVDAVEIAQRHRAALFAPELQGRHTRINLHSLSVSQVRSTNSFSTRSTPPATWARPKNCPASSRTR